MLKINKVSKYYGNIKAVDNLTFTVKKGEIFGLLGVNGAGKTTTFRMIMGLLETDGGSITLNDKKIDYDVTDTIGFLTEERSLLIKMTVTEQAIYYGVLKGMTKEKILTELDYWLERFLIKEYKDRKIKELSKGNQQKIQMIMAVINNPQLLILDEAFAGLDPINVELFKEVILEFKNRGAMIIFSSHRMEHVELFCEKLVILVQGRSVLEGYLTDIKTNFRKKNIFISGDINETELKKIDGVLSVNKRIEDYEIKIENQDKVNNIFSYVSKCKNVTKFIVEEPTLNEIFVEKVGESYEN